MVYVKSYAAYTKIPIKRCAQWKCAHFCQSVQAIAYVVFALDYINSNSVLSNNYCRLIRWRDKRNNAGAPLEREMELQQNHFAKAIIECIAHRMKLLCHTNTMQKLKWIFGNLFQFEMHVKWVFVTAMSVLVGVFHFSAVVFDNSDCYCYCRFQSSV